MSDTGEHLYGHALGKFVRIGRFSQLCALLRILFNEDPQRPELAAALELDIDEVKVVRGKFRTLRIFIEKNAVERAKLAETANPDELPKGVPVETLSE